MCDSYKDEYEEAYYHGCSCCGAIPNEDGECECPPDDYVKPGTQSLLYVNAYCITRQYGGPEEGGWYYNHAEPVASIPVRAISVVGHSDTCWTCEAARNGEIDKHTGEKHELCKWSYQLKALDLKEVEKFKKHLEDIFEDLNDGNIYSVLGGSQLEICVEDHSGESPEHPYYE